MKKTRVLMFIFTIAVLAVSIFTYVFQGNDFFIRKWNLPLDPPGFLDSRQFAWASEAYAQGYDPLIENPVNPAGHQLNYPRIWHLLFRLGINESHTNILGSIVVIIFFLGIGVFWFSKKFDTLTYLILSLVILSPVVMLGIERSNIELIIFFVLALALTVDCYSVTTALCIFEFAAVLKIYPVFGFMYLLKEDKRRFWLLFIPALAVFIIYALLSFNDFLQVYKTTPKLVGSSFGINVWWMGLTHARFFNLHLSDTTTYLLKITSYTAATLILLITLYWGSHNNKNPMFKKMDYIDAFRVGAGIYIGCFLLMNTHDYRLIFLIFTVPQLVAWMRNEEHAVSTGPLIILITIVISSWNAFIMRFLGRKVTFILEEFSNWVILAGLLYLLFASLPEWLISYPHRLFNSKGQAEERS